MEIRRSRARITAQLVEAEAEGYIWVERFNHEMQDISELRDEMTPNIWATIAPVLGLLEVHRTLGKRPWGLTARGYGMRSASVAASYDFKSLKQARHFARRAHWNCNPIMPTPCPSSQ
jgi:hypothetical protein